MSSREDAAALYGQSFVNQQERMVEWADLEVVASRYSMNADDVDPSREAEAWVPHAAMRIAKVSIFPSLLFFLRPFCIDTSWCFLLFEPFYALSPLAE